MQRVARALAVRLVANPRALRGSGVDGQSVTYAPVGLTFLESVLLARVAVPAAFDRVGAFGGLTAAERKAIHAERGEELTWPRTRGQPVWAGGDWVDRRQRPANHPWTT